MSQSGLFESLRKLFGGSASCAEQEQPSAIDYVEWLLKGMLRSSRTELTVDTARPLPDVGLLPNAGPAPCTPKTSLVINRLKVLSDVSPVMRSSTGQGRFERPLSSHSLVVTTQFRDEGDRSTCSIRLKVRA